MSLTTLFLRDTHHGGDAHQPQQVATALAAFVAAASTSLDVAIYDFRLSTKPAATVVGALVSAADRGVRVRIGYDAGKPANGTALDFALMGTDPAPVGTAAWVQEHFAGTKVQTEPIEAGRYLMHSKYLVRDGQTVWTGSTNFTDDAWTRQENNILVVTSPAVAAAYSDDFEQMWQAKSITHAGAGDAGSTTVQGMTVAWDFSPGDGPKIDAALVALVNGATTRIAVASMLFTSHPLLAALAAAVTRGVPVSGIYDSGQMDPIVKLWKTRPADAQALADFHTLTGHLSAKPSTPYTPTSVHDFMHDKVMVVDDTVVTGSYNFSLSAESNAENQLRLTGPSLAATYAEYVATISAVYEVRHSA